MAADLPLPTTEYVPLLVSEGACLCFPASKLTIPIPLIDVRINNERMIIWASIQTPFGSEKPHFGLIRYAQQNRLEVGSAFFDADDHQLCAIIDVWAFAFLPTPKRNSSRKRGNMQSSLPSTSCTGSGGTVILRPVIPNVFKTASDVKIFPGHLPVRSLRYARAEWDTALGNIPENAPSPHGDTGTYFAEASDPIAPFLAAHRALMAAASLARPAAVMPPFFFATIFIDALAGAGFFVGDFSLICAQRAC